MTWALQVLMYTVQHTSFTLHSETETHFITASRTHWKCTQCIYVWMNTLFVHKQQTYVSTYALIGHMYVTSMSALCTLSHQL